MTTTITRDLITLAKGNHNDTPPPTGDQPCQVCIFEAYNLLTAPPGTTPTITDECPADVSRVLHQFGMNLNDTLPDDTRQTLKDLLPNGGPSPLAGTRDDGLDERRRYLALDWLIRTYTPAWLDLAGLSDEARALRELRQIVDLVAARSAGPVVLEAQAKAREKWSAAESAAEYAAEYAARYAAGYAAKSAAEYAAESAAKSAARYAAEYAARYAAGYAAESAAESAAKSAAEYAARYAAGYAARYAAGSAAGSAAESAARSRKAMDDALAPTVAELQLSAIDLYRRMIQPAQD